ncbi:hypothetical protein JW916_12895 [Candidatus Sumerlaeota bacterium]|nr:hypothetical protein [Candidatus Sumerlaeota bacterium]
MTKPIKIPPPDDMSYEAAEWNLLRRGMSMTFDQQIEWLEEAKDLVERLANARADAAKPGNRPETDPSK